jgi:hypothetical protein
MMKIPLTKCSNARKPEQVIEAKLRRIMRGIWVAYASVGILTLVFATWLLSGQCTSVAGCAFAAVKVFIWTIFWPFFWLFFWNGKL